VKSRNDNDLIELCIKGDQPAWKELVSRYHRLVYSVADAYCPLEEDAADVFQQVWMQCYMHLSDLRDTEALPAWLITVTRRCAFAVIKARRPSEPLDEELPDLSYRLAMVENEHVIEQALEQLPDRCRDLVRLLYFAVEEPSYVEIAGKLGMPVASIGPNRARCLEKLRKFIAGNGGTRATTGVRSHLG
jgi:RNA polymerase sigma factor (sigma-70 family)